MDAPTSELGATVRRVRNLIDELARDHFFAEALGFDCVDGNGDHGSSADVELGTRLGKAHLWSAIDSEFSEADLCDVIEVFHDLAARPKRGWYHSYCDFGFHPSAFHRKSGQALFRWRINQVLETSSVNLRLAEDGEDIGRMVHASPPGLGELVESTLASPPSDDRQDVAHAVALYRSRCATRQDQRSAVVALAGILEPAPGLFEAGFVP